jgi:phage terminase large subunit
MRAAARKPASGAPQGFPRFQIPRAFSPLLKPSRYKGAYGGRGSAKSHAFGEMLIMRALLQPGLRAVCIREVQRTLKESVKRLLEDKIQARGVGSQFGCMDAEIRTPGDGLVIFQGMQNHTAESIKSLEGFHVALIEESQALSARSLELLRPTIRMEGSELWFPWNPRSPDDPVDKLFRGAEPPPDSVCVPVSWRDNPWFPDVLRAEMEYDYRVDPETAEHVWGGAYLTRSDAQVLSGKWSVAEFDPITEGEGAWDGPYQGCDWGFHPDPTTLVRFWLTPGGELMIEHEYWEVGCDTVDMPMRMAAAVPDARLHVTRSDNARPEMASHMRREGWPFQSAPKWPGSVEDGVTWLRSRPRIVIHPRCVRAIHEAKHWSYKVDRLTNNVLPVLKEGNDHCWDAVRYGAAPMIRRRVEWVIE